MNLYYLGSDYNESDSSELNIQSIQKPKNGNKIKYTFDCNNNRSRIVTKLITILIVILIIIIYIIFYIIFLWCEK